MRVRIGDRVTRGLGAGGNPDVGQKAAEESRDDLLEALKGADMVFIAAGMGGGTGTGAAPIVAEIARELGRPDRRRGHPPLHLRGHAAPRERPGRHQRAARSSVDTLITIPNDRLLHVADKRLPMVEAYKLADDVLRQGIQGISDLITVPGLINLDFADVKAIMSNAGSALLAIGYGSGDNRAATPPRPPSPAPCWTSPSTAPGASCSTSPAARTSPSTRSTRPRSIINEAADPDANIIFGQVIDPRLQGDVRITVIATGFDQKPPPAPRGADPYRDSPLRQHAATGATPGRAGPPPATSAHPLPREAAAHPRHAGATTSEPYEPRPRPRPPRTTDERSGASSQTQTDNLDIPPFLRRPR